MFYPIFLKLQNKKCLILGGGAVAERKAKVLLKTGARVTVVSLDFTHVLKRLAKRNKKIRLVHLRVIARSPVKGDVAIPWMRLLPACRQAGAFARNDIVLAFACTSSRKENLKFSRECRRRGIWVNQADDLEACDFTVPASFKKGRVQIAVGTSGLSPYLARELKERIARVLTQEDLRFLKWLESEKRRRLVIQRLATPDLRKIFFQKLVHPRFLRLFRKPETAKIETHFNRLLNHLNQLKEMK
jgi:precorrin-2 dehydrogenase/sirohydrochlorin ferrochelatase